MDEIIEGIGNDVTFVLLFFVLLLAILIPLYVLRPNNSLLLTQTSSNDDTPQSFNNIPAEPPDITTSTSNSLLQNSSYSELNDSLRNLNETSTHNIQREEMISVKIINNNEASSVHTVSKNITLLDLIKKAYPVEVNMGKRVRFVFHGHLLQGDHTTMTQFNITHNSVIHSVITDQNAQSESENINNVQNELDLSWLFLPLVVSIVTFSWAGYFFYVPSAFSTTSFSILGVLTSLLAVLWYNMTVE